MTEADTYEPWKTDEGVVVAQQVTTRFSIPAQRLTLTNMDSPYSKAQPTPIHWAVGWADLMMTMFVLFLVMYLYQSAQQRQMIGQELSSPLVKTVQ
jgi:hypothetical protein